MSEKTELAAHYHDTGYGCGQAVLAPFAEDYGLSEELALKISTGFGSGMGRMFEVCGALTGAFMVIGLKHGKVITDGTKYGSNTVRLTVWSRNLPESLKRSTDQSIAGILSVMTSMTVTSVP